MMAECGHAAVRPGKEKSRAGCLGSTPELIPTGAKLLACFVFLPYLQASPIHSRQNVFKRHGKGVLTWDDILIFEPTCANAQWALMRRFPSVRLSICHCTKSH